MDRNTVKRTMTICNKQFLLALAITCASSLATAATYTYDNIGRLTSISYPGLGAINYAYDATGNLTNILQVPLAAPGVTTSAATGISTTGATLNGNVIANGAATTVTCDYGLSTSYTSHTAASPSSLAANLASNVSLAISGLTCGTTYHFRVAALNSVGPNSGNDMSFTTSVCAPGAPTLNSVTFGPGKAIVAFTPSNIGGVATTFTATCTAAGKPTRSATGTASPITVSGLIGGVVYSCSVVANNSTASSGSSAIMQVTPTKAVDLTPILMLLLD